METSALVATLTTSLAIGLTIVMLRLLRQERQRSEARVASLVALSAGTDAAGPAFAFEPPVRLRPRTQAAIEPRRQPAVPPASGTSHNRPAATRFNVANVEIFRDADPVVPVAAPQDLFEPAQRDGRKTLFYVGAGALALAALIALSFGWALSSNDAPAVETTASIATGAPAAPAPLALLALRHEQSADGTLVISGIVRNPAESIARQKLFAAASLVDSSGTLVATARAPLDFTLLGPGEESPFVVRVSGASGVARYRIGFRDADGKSVAHLDRR
jgi:hypothetical protein